MYSGSILILTFILFWKQILSHISTWSAWHSFTYLSARYYLDLSPFSEKECLFPIPGCYSLPFPIIMTTEKQYWAVLCVFGFISILHLRICISKPSTPNTFFCPFCLSSNYKLPPTSEGSPSNPYLWLGGGQSEPYSWTCMPKKHKSTPSISSKAKRALVR